MYLNLSSNFNTIYKQTLLSSEYAFRDCNSFLSSEDRAVGCLKFRLFSCNLVPVLSQYDCDVIWGNGTNVNPKSIGQNQWTLLSSEYAFRDCNSFLSSEDQAYLCPVCPLGDGVPQ